VLKDVANTVAKVIPIYHERFAVLVNPSHYNVSMRIIRVVVTYGIPLKRCL
jgi:hypothetical protein